MPHLKIATTPEEGRRFAIELLEHTREEAKHQREDHLTYVLEAVAPCYETATSWLGSDSAVRGRIGTAAVVLKGEALGAFVDELSQFVARQNPNRIGDETFRRFGGIVGEQWEE